MILSICIWTIRYVLTNFVKILSYELKGKIMTMYKTISYYEIILIGYFSIRNVYELGSQHFLFSVSSLTINKSFAKVCAIQHKRVLMRVLLPDISRDPHTCTRYVTIVLKLKCPLENQNHFKEFLWLWKFYIEVTSEITFANIFILFLSKHILICKFSFSKKECEKFFFCFKLYIFRSWRQNVTV